MENAASVVAKFGLVFVMPHVRMSNIQGIPGWTQWMSTRVGLSATLSAIFPPIAIGLSEVYIF